MTFLFHSVKVKFLSLLLFNLVFLAGINSFSQTANITDGCVPLTVNFTPPSGYATHYWDFKDGSTSTLSTPSNTFLTVGNYTVEFREIVTGPIIGTITIDVVEKPDIKIFTDTTKGCIPLTVNFSDSTVLSPSVNVTNYSWVFEDGGSAFGNNVSHIFNSEGSFFASLELTTNIVSCNVSKRFNDLISVSEQPKVNFSTFPNPPAACTPPLNVRFSNLTTTNSGPLTFQWDFGTSLTSTSSTPSPVSYTSRGDFEVTLIATDRNNCSDTASKMIVIGQPKADFFFKTFPDTICIGVEDTIINNSSPGDYSWNFGPDADLIMFFNDNPIVEFTKSGRKTLTLTVTADGCVKDTTISIYVDEVKADFTFSPTYFCSYPAEVSFISTSTNAASYSWNFDKQSVSTEENPTFTYENKDTNLYSKNGLKKFVPSLRVTSAFGCENKYEMDTLKIFEPNALILPSVSDGCVPLEVTFSDSSSTNPAEPITSWEWHFGDGTVVNSTTNANQTHTYNSTGEYNAFLIIVNSAACNDTSYFTTIKVGDKITPDFTVDKTAICLGDTVSFTDNTNSSLLDSIDTWNYSSDGDRLFSCFTNSDAKWSFENEIGPQNVTFSVGFNGCFSSTTKTNLISISGAKASIYYEKNCEELYRVKFIDSSNNATSLQWSFGDGRISTKEDTTYNYNATGSYKVFLSAENTASSCPASLDSVTIKILEPKAEFAFETLLCKDVAYPFDASGSEMVNSDCRNGYSYTWLFSDPSMRPATRQFASEFFSFPTSGRNDITLVVTDENGCKDSVTNSVKVYGIEADFNLSETTICPPTAVDFTELSIADTTIKTWDWDLGNNSFRTFTQQQNFTSTYSQFLDPFEVELIVEDALGCVDTLYQEISMYRPISIISSTDSTLCVGEIVDFDATDYTDQGSNLSFNWDFRDGTSSTLQNPSHQFGSGGDYLVTLSIEEVSSACPNTIVLPISVKDFPIANFSTSVDGVPFVCPNESVLFTDGSIKPSSPPVEYQWNFGNGQTSSFRDPGASYEDNGDYTVEMIVTVPEPYGCPDTTSRNFKVKGPKGNFKTDLRGDTICRLESVLFTLIDTTAIEDYRWDFGDGDSANNISPINHVYRDVPPSGETFAKLIITNSDGSCQVTADTVINIHEVVAEFQRNDGIDTAICLAPFPITNRSLNSDFWSWNFGNGDSSNLRSPLTIDYNQAGKYTIRLAVRSESLFCTDTIFKEVILHPIPEIDVLSDTICEGETVTLTVNNPDSNWDYNWTSDPFTVITNNSQAIAKSKPTITTAFYALVTDTNNCINKDTADVLVINPLLLQDFDTTIVIGDSIDLPLYIDPALYFFKWNPKKGLSCLDCSPPRVQPLEDIIYNLELNDIFSCFTDNVDYDIKIHPETFISMPTSFTPNGDGNNDLLFIEGWGIKELLNYQIYNRWGELIFETTDINSGWDGTYKGVLQNNEVYVYKVRVTTWKDEEKFLEGYINLLR